MSVSELRTPLPTPRRPPAAPAARPEHDPSGASRLRVPARRVRLPLPLAIVLGSLLASALTLLLPTAPTYDPWSWIVWGREIAQLDLDTVFGPSWKPLPVLFTTVFSLFGEAAPELWVWIARAGALAALPLAFLLAARLAGRIAGVAAVAGLAVAPWWLFNGAMGNSEGLLVALALAAILTLAAGRHGWTFALAVGVGLLRPEAWPFLGLYGLWLLRGDRRRAPWVVGGGVGVVVLWLGPELWGSGDAFRASSRAQQPDFGPAFADSPVRQVLEDAKAMLPRTALGGVALAVVAVVARRVRGERARLAVGVLGLGAGWLALVAAMTAGGYSGNQRYLVLPAALAVVLGAAGVGWALAVLGRRAVLLAPLAALAFLAPQADLVPMALRDIAFQSRLVTDLERLPLVRCGAPTTGPRLVPAVAWRYDVHLRDVELVPAAPATVLHVRVQPDLPRAPITGSTRPALTERGAWKLRCQR